MRHASHVLAKNIYLIKCLVRRPPLPLGAAVESIPENAVLLCERDKQGRQHEEKAHRQAGVLATWCAHGVLQRLRGLYRQYTDGEATCVKVSA